MALTTSMNDFDAVQSRLRNLAVPVDDAVAEGHLSSLAFAPPAPVPLRSRSRVVVAGALVAGTLLGSATLAGAVTGNLPDTAQNAAHTALSKVGVGVPKAQAKKAEHANVNSSSSSDNSSNGTPRFLDGCTKPDGSAFSGNHGQYVTAHPDDEATADVNEREVAAQSRCGKPLVAGTQDAGTTDEKATTEDTGKPESPGKSADHTPTTKGRSADHKPADAGKPEGAGD